MPQLGPSAPPRDPQWGDEGSPPCPLEEKTPPRPVHPARLLSSGPEAWTCSPSAGSFSGPARRAAGADSVEDCAEGPGVRVGDCGRAERSALPREPDEGGAWPAGEGIQRPPCAEASPRSCEKFEGGRRQRGLGVHASWRFRGPSVVGLRRGLRSCVPIQPRRVRSSSDDGAQNTKSPERPFASGVWGLSSLAALDLGSLGLSESQVRDARVSGDSAARTSPVVVLGSGWALTRHPRAAALDAASAVPSRPSDLEAEGNDAGAPRAPAPGGEGEPLDALLGGTDKELKAGPGVTAGSTPTAPGTPWQREPQDEAMDPACGCSRGALPRPCRVLVLLNPRGGKGKALQQFQRLVLPLLAEAEVSFKLTVTERQNHARELVRAEELGRWDALVIMSGDGLMHEVVNGLMDRPDWETAIQKPLCSLPGGSGNALAASLNHYAGYGQVTNEDLLTNCTRLLCGRLLSPMNLLSLHAASGIRLFSVLSLAWGLVADVDVESEKYRCLGEKRFTVGTFFRLVNLRTYRGQLAYLPTGSAVLSKTPTSPLLLQGGPVDSHLVPLEEPVPSHWTVVPEQDFVLVLALLHTHMASKMFTAPMGRCAAGVMHLFYVRAGVPRTMLLRLFLAMENGTHMEYGCPYLVHVPVVAFRLECKDGRGVFAVDGELLISEAVQGQVQPDYLWMVSGGREPPPTQKPQQKAL